MPSRRSGWDTKGYAELQVIATRLKAAGDRGLTNHVRREIRKIGKPVAAEVLHEGAEKMPHRGGLSRNIEATKKVTVSTGLGKRVSVSLSLRGGGNSRTGSYSLRRIDGSGTVRHPVYGHRKTWVAQSVGARAWTNAFQKKAPALRKAVLSAARQTVNDVGRGL